MTTMNQNTARPTRKVMAATCGAAAAQLIVNGWNIAVPDRPLGPEIEMPLTILLTAALGWIVPESVNNTGTLNTRI